MADLNFSAFPDDLTLLAKAGTNDVVHCGWVPPSERDEEQQKAHDEAVAEMPPFLIVGSSMDTVTKACLWDCSTLANGGKHFSPLRQTTGSCVGYSGGGAVWYLSAVEVVRLRDAEQVLLPFLLLPYGRSRMYAGLRGRGDGSYGSAFAKAIRTDGIVPAETNGLPRWMEQDGIGWGRDNELTWSDGARISEDWLKQSRKYLVQTTAQVKSADDVREAIKNYYPVHICSDWGGRIGCPTEGDPPVLLNKRVTTWYHAMLVLAWWDHPTLGEIFWIQNSWGNPHGNDPAGGPPGGFWVKRGDMDHIARQGDSFAFSQFQGFPGQVGKLDFAAF